MKRPWKCFRLAHNGLPLHNTQILNSDPIFPSKKNPRKYSTEYDNTDCIYNQRGQKCWDFFPFFFPPEKTSDLSDVHFKSINPPQHPSISVCKLIISPNLFSPRWDGNKASLYHSASCSELCAVIMWPRSQSPAEERAGGHMQLATLLEPWPTSLIWLMWHEQTATPAPARQWDTEPTSSHLRAQTQIPAPELAKQTNKHACLRVVSSPVHSRLKSLHRVQVNVPVVAADRKNSPHDGRHPDPPAGGGQLGYILPAMHPWVKALYGAQGWIVIKTAFRRKMNNDLTCVSVNVFYMATKHWCL